MVAALFGLANVAVPGPLIWLQLLERESPKGSGFSMTLPLRAALFGRDTVWLLPALTMGPASGLTVMVTLDVFETKPSVPVRRST